MANVAFPLDDLRSNASGQLLTFVVPANGGCNLNCPFCFIAQRGEITQTHLWPADYVRFIERIDAVEPVLRVAIQGYEPLLPDALPYATAILRTARARGIPASLVTNGTQLAAAVTRLAPLRMDRIGVSLDAADSKTHDRLRGVPGAWQATTSAIAATFDRLAAAGMGMTVLSVLMPHRRAQLDDMPRLLRTLGLRDWIVNPLKIFGKDPWDRPGNLARLLDDLAILSERASALGVRLAIDDAFGHMTAKLLVIDPARTARLNIRRLPAGVTVSRLTPSGEFALGEEIVHRIAPHARRWDPAATLPADFLRARHGFSANALAEEISERPL